MRLAPAIALVPLLGACAHAGKLAPLPTPEGPRGIVSIETRPSGARVVMERGGTRYLACRKTPCRFEAAPGQASVEMKRFLYRFRSEIEVGAGEEARYVFELQGGWPHGGFLTGVLGMIAFVPATIMSSRQGDSADGPEWAGTFGVLAASSATLVFAPFVWPWQPGGIVSQERSRIDGGEGRIETGATGRAVRPLSPRRMRAARSRRRAPAPACAR